MTCLASWRCIKTIPHLFGTSALIFFVAGIHNAGIPRSQIWRVTFKDLLKSHCDVTVCCNKDIGTFFYVSLYCVTGDHSFMHGFVPI